MKWYAVLTWGWISFLSSSVLASQNPLNIPSVTNIAALKALGAASAQYGTVYVKAYAGGLFGGGTFIWKPASVATPNVCTIFQATGVSNGRWFRQLPGNALTVYDCGASGNNSDDDTAASQALLTISGANSNPIFPCGSYVWTATVTSSALRQHIQGGGQFCTQIRFAPTADDIALLVSAGSDPVTGSSISGIAFTSDDCTHVKTAISLSDVSVFDLENVSVSGSCSVAGTALWHDPSNASTALLIAGRDAITVRKPTFQADRPEVITANPNTSRSSDEDCDHCHFQDQYLIAYQNPTILVDPTIAVNLSNVTFDGYQALVGGTSCFSFVNTHLTVASTEVSFLGAPRCEQGSDPTAYSIDVQPGGTGSLQNFYIQGFRFDTSRLGLRLGANVLRTTLANSVFQRTSGDVITAVGSGGTKIRLINVSSQNGATATFTSYAQTSGDYTGSSQPIPFNAEYEYWDGTGINYPFFTENSAKVWHNSRSLPDATTLGLPAAVANGMKAGTLTLSAYSATGPIVEYAVVNFNASNEALLINSGNVQTSAGAGKIGIIYNGGNIQISNNMGQTLTIVLTITWF